MQCKSLNLFCRPVDIGVHPSMVNRINVKQDACEQEKPPPYTSRLNI